MQHSRCPAHGSPHCFGVANVPDIYLDAIAMALFEPLGVLICATPSEIIQDQNSIAASR
jgi:hypothetical protein